VNEKKEMRKRVRWKKKLTEVETISDPRNHHVLKFLFVPQSIPRDLNSKEMSPRVHLQERFPRELETT
jgi:hypothetical protein